MLACATPLRDGALANAAAAADDGKETTGKRFDATAGGGDEGGDRGGGGGGGGVKRKRGPGRPKGSFKKHAGEVVRRRKLSAS